MRSQEFTGKTTQEAIDAGLAALGVTIADVHVDVLQEGAKGLFGLFGSKPARVRLTVMEDEKEDEGFDDLLSTFSLNEPRRKQPAKAAARPERKPVEARPVEKKPIEARPVEKKPVEARPVEKKPVEKKPAEARPAAQKPIEAREQTVKAEAQAENKTVEAQPDMQAKVAPKAPRAPREKKPRAPKAEQGAKAEAPAEPREYAPMVPAKTFTPTEPPVIHAEDTPAGRAQCFLMDVTRLMNVKVDIYVDDSAEDSLYIHMIGDTLGILIGRRGETLDALQYLTSLQVNKGRDGYVRVTLDTENYRAKREDSLRRLAQRMANRAQKTGRKVVLEPMNPYERRVLHTALQNHPAVTTHSEGEEPNRRVVIMLANQPERSAQAENAKKAEKDERGEKRPSSHRRSRRGRGRGPKPAPQADVPQTAAAPEQTEAAVHAPGEE